MPDHMDSPTCPVTIPQHTKAHADICVPAGTPISVWTGMHVQSLLACQNRVAHD